MGKRTVRIMLLAAAALASLTALAQQPCRPLPSGIAGWWPGDDTPNDLTFAADNAQLINGATFGPGIVAHAFSMDGVNDRVEVPDTPAMRPVQFTLAAWIRQDIGPQWACIICKQAGSGDADSYSLWLNNGELRGGMFRYAEAVSTGAVPVNQFVHVATTYDGTNIRLYQDGKLIARAAGPAAAVPYDSNPVLIGAEDNGVGFYDAFFKGSIDEPQIFSRALSDCEIRQLASVAPSGNCKGDTDGDLIRDFQDNCPGVANAAQIDADVDGAGDLCDCAAANPGVSAAPGDRNELSFYSSSDLEWCHDPAVTGSATVYDVLRGDLSTLPSAFGTAQCRSRCAAPSTGLVGWWPGDGNTTDLIAANNGTLENGATYGAGLVLSTFFTDGVNDRVRTGNLTLGNTFSVAAWVNSDLVNQGSYRRILETSYASQFYLGTDVSGVAYKFIVKNAAAPYGTVNGGTVNPGHWQLVVGTYDGTNGTLYVDGKLVASSAFTPPGTVTLPLIVGSFFNGAGTGWKGRIDETQIWNRALTAAEVQAMYESGSAGQCKVALGGTDAQWTTPWAADLAIPALGHGFWYVYRGRNSCGTGSYGFMSSGTERISAACN